MQADGRVKCKECSKVGYFKLDLCAKCRATNCRECGKRLRKNYVGQSTCPDCVRKTQARVRGEITA